MRSEHIAKLFPLARGLNLLFLFESLAKLNLAEASQSRFKSSWDILIF